MRRRRVRRLSPSSSRAPRASPGGAESRPCPMRAVQVAVLQQLAMGPVRRQRRLRWAVAAGFSRPSYARRACPHPLRGRTYKSDRSPGCCASSPLPPSPCPYTCTPFEARHGRILVAIVSTKLTHLNARTRLPVIESLCPATGGAAALRTSLNSATTDPRPSARPLKYSRSAAIEPRLSLFAHHQLVPSTLFPPRLVSFPVSFSPLDRQKVATPQRPPIPKD